MNWLVEFDSTADEEILTAFEFYKQVNELLAIQFLENIEGAIKILKSHPYFQRRYGQTHCLPLKRFPYMLHFKIREKEKSVYVIGCIHTSLNPDKSWR